MTYQSPVKKSLQGEELADKRVLKPNNMINQESILASNLISAPTNPIYKKSIDNSSSSKRRLSDVFSPPEKRVPQTENIQESKTLKTHPNIKSFACRSLAGSMDGIIAKTNQDGYIAIPSFGGKNDQHFFAVIDGHGNYGEEVTHYIKTKLPYYLEDAFKEKNISGNLVKDEIMQAFASVFKRINTELYAGDIDVSLSGCTINCVFLTKDKLYCINVGDSRSIITIHKNYEWFVMPLSEDHKPELPREKSRIEKTGGRVACMEDNHGQPVGPLRVWLRDSMIPGLAMSRSIGDQIGKDAGVISDPDISCIDLTKEHKFIVLATDGVWEFITNEDVRFFINKRLYDGLNLTLGRKMLKRQLIS